MKEAEACWGPNHAVAPTSDPDIMQERMTRQMIRNWARNSIKATSYDQLELKRDKCAYYRSSDSKYIYNGPTMLKLLLDVISPEARVNARDLKDKIRNTKASDFDRDIVKMLTSMELLHENILSENESHDDFIINALAALHTAQDTSFLGTIEKIQDECDAGDSLSVQQVITRATTKYNKLLNRNEHHCKDNKKYLSFKTNGQTSNKSQDNASNDKKDVKAYLKGIPE